MELVTVFRSFSPAEAQLVRSRLDAADIPAEVVNELAALSLDGYSLATGGILVQVPEAYAAEAKALIASAQDATDGPATP
jgi:Putative prokaryotic signal transducing protein